MRGVYIGNQKVLVSLVWGGKIIVSAEDLSLTPDLIINGVYDIPLTKYLVKNVKPGSTVFDVGANIGCFTVLMGYLVGRQGLVVAYEANPDTCALLRDNVAMNYLMPQTTIYNKAIYVKTSEVSLYKTARFHGNTSLKKHDKSYFDLFGEERVDEIKVEAEPLDVHLNKIDIIDLIKIDIEGGEYDAFLGMQGLIERGVVKTAVFELNRLMLGDKWNAFYMLLEGLTKLHDVKFYTLTEEGDLVPQRLEELFAQDQISSVVVEFRQ